MDKKMEKKKGYVGSIPNSGTMNVKAPHQTVPKTKGTVKTGSDLRSK